MARTCLVFATIVMLVATPAQAWTPDFDAAFKPFPHRGPRRAAVPTVEVALPVARPDVVVPRKTAAPAAVGSSRRSTASVGQTDVSKRLASYCARPGKSSLSWIRVSGRRYYCPR